MLKMLGRDELHQVMEKIDKTKLGTFEPELQMWWMLIAKYDPGAEFPTDALATPIIGGMKLHTLWEGTKLTFILEGPAKQMLALGINPG